MSRGEGKVVIAQKRNYGSVFSRFRLRDLPSDFDRVKEALDPHRQNRTQKFIDMCRRKHDKSDHVDAVLQLIDMKLMIGAQKKFKVHSFEAFRLEATFSLNRSQLDVARDIVGDDWGLMTRMLVRKGLIEIPEKGPAQVTSKGARFLAIYSNPIFKN